VAKFKGIANDTAYPYTGNIQSCQYDESLFSAKISSYEFVNGDEEYLKSVLAAVGPLPVGIRGSLNSFYYYSSGIYDDSACDEKLDHAACVVGKFLLIFGLNVKTELNFFKHSNFRLWN